METNTYPLGGGISAYLSVSKLFVILCTLMCCDTDVDECAVNNGGCSPHAYSTNTPGSFTCTCIGGYVGYGFSCCSGKCASSTHSTLVSAYLTYLTALLISRCGVSHRLQLNADKTELIWVGSKHNLAKLQHHD